MPKPQWRTSWHTWAVALIAVAAPVEGQEPAALPADHCGPRLLRADDFAETAYRSLAVRGREARMGSRTPYAERTECEGDWFTPDVELFTGVSVRQGVRRFTTTDPDDTQPELPDRIGPAGRLRVWIPMGARAEVVADGGYGLPLDEARWSLRELYGVIRAGPFYLWGGRRAVGYGPAMGGGVVLDGSVPLDGVGLGMRAPGRLPWIFEGLGRWGGEASMSRLEDNAGVADPLLFAVRGSWLPTDGLEVAVTHGVMFGGEGTPPLTLKRIAGILLGFHAEEDGEFVQLENRILAVDVIWRGEAGDHPYSAYAVLGMDDSSGAYHESPALVGGFEVAHPTQPWRIGMEYAYIYHGFRHGTWYRHSLYREGWTNGGRWLAHPLSGPGTEGLVRFTTHDPSGEWEAQVGLRTRHRTPGNSLGPEFLGRSWGAIAQGRWTVGRRFGAAWDLFGQANAEWANREPIAYATAGVRVTTAEH